MRKTAPKRLWILNGDAHGMGDDTRRYQSTKAAVKGWDGWRRPGGLMVLMSASGPVDMTAEFEKLHWPDREVLADSTTTADPAKQVNYNYHIDVCLKNPAEVEKILAKKRSDPHVCTWVEYTAAMDKAYQRDIVNNARIIEDVLDAKGIE